jgi:hypothetical protein
MNSAIAPSILGNLADLETAVAELANTWRPDDPAYRADLYRQIMMNLSYSYFAYFHADAEHPDWAPLWNPVYTCQPNPDDIYLYTPIRGDLSYRVHGDRGSCAKLIFVTQHGLAGMTDDYSDFYGVNTIDEGDFAVGDDGKVDILFSADRPEGHVGNWAQVDPRADTMFVRYRMVDWERERDPQLMVECLDPVQPKPRLTSDEIAARLTSMAKFPGRAAKLFLGMQNGIKAQVGINHFDPTRLPGLDRQVYWPAVFQLDQGEALIVETELPKVRPYWNIQLNDPYFNAVEYVYRQSSLNAAQAHIDSDERFRAVIALEDPGVPNWLDPAGFTEGTIYGRWYDCDTTPTPTIKRVKLAELRDHLPSDTPVVNRDARADQLRRRVAAAQRRRRW